MSDDEKHVEVLNTERQKEINESHRFALLLLGSFCCIVCSFSYAYNLISGGLVERYSLSVRDSATISTVALVFQYATLPYAFLYDFAGPLPIAIIGVTYFTIGSVCLAMCFEDKIKGDVVRLSVFNAFMGTGSGMFDLVSTVTVLSHFPTHKGWVTAFLKTFTGLGSAIAASIQLGFFNEDYTNYFFFLMALTAATGILSIFFMTLPPYHMVPLQLKCYAKERIEKNLRTRAQYLRQRPQVVRFYYGLFMLIVLVVYLPTQSAIISYRNLRENKSVVQGCAIGTIVLVVIYCLLAVPLPNSFNGPRVIETEDGEEEEEEAALEELESGSNFREFSDPDVPAKAAPEEAAVVGATADADRDALMDEAPLYDESAEEKQQQQQQQPRGRKKPVVTDVDFIAPQYTTSFLRNLLSFDLWALWWTFFTIVGAEFTVIYNATPLMESMSGAPVDNALRALLSVLNGVGSAVGRLLMSGFEIFTSNQAPEKRIPLTWALFAPNISIIITIILFLSLPAAALPLPYVLAALGNGCLAAAILLTMRTLYQKDVAKHYYFCFLATMMASILMHRMLYSEWYTVQAELIGDPKHCFKKRCSIMPLCVMLGLCCTSFATDILVHVRYVRFCRRVLAERARLREEAEADDENNNSGEGINDDGNNNNDDDDMQQHDERYLEDGAGEPVKEDGRRAY